MGILKAISDSNPRKLIFTASISVFFVMVDLAAQFVDVVLGENSDFSMSRLIISILCCIAVSWILFSVLDLLALNQRTTEESQPKTDRTQQRITVIVAFLVPLAGWIIQYLRYWPMASMNDTYWILQHPLGMAVQHPLSYNLLITFLTRVGTYLGGSELAGVVFAAVVQMLLWAAAFTSVIWYLLKIEISRVAIYVLVAFFALVPVVGNYSFALVKDSYFSLFVLLLIPVLMQIWRSRGAVLASWRGCLVCAVVFVGFAIMRNNGLIALLILLPLVIFYCTANRRRAVVFAILVMTVSLVPAAATSVLSGRQKFVESVGVPLQMIGYTITHGNNAANEEEGSSSSEGLSRVDNSCISDSSSAYFNRLFPLESWANIYDPLSVDATKDSPDFDKEFLQETKSEFLVQWAKTALSCPSEFLTGYAVHTSALWRIDPDPVGFGGQSFFTSPVSNFPSNVEQLRAEYVERGIGSNTPYPQSVSDLVGGYNRIVNFHTPGAGFWLWAALLVISGFIYRKRSEWSPIFAPSLVIWLTLMLATPVTGPFRYVQFITMVVPIAAAVLLGSKKIRRWDE